MIDWNVPIAFAYRELGRDGLNDLFNCPCSSPQIDVYVPVIFIWSVFLSSLSFGLAVPCAVTESRLMKKKGKNRGN